MSEIPDAPGDASGVDALDQDVTVAEDVPVADTDLDLAVADVDVDLAAVDVEDVVVAPEDANQAVGGMAKGVLEYMARQIVDEPDAVVIEPDERGPSRVDLRLHVAPDDMGKIIGRRGRVAQAIRTVVRAVGAREGLETTVDIVD